MSRSNAAHGGRQPGGIDGSVRDKYHGFKHAAVERKVIDDLLEQEGFPPTGAGMRDYLLAQALATRTQRLRSAA